MDQTIVKISLDFLKDDGNWLEKLWAEQPFLKDRSSIFLAQAQKLDFDPQTLNLRVPLTRYMQSDFIESDLGLTFLDAAGSPTFFYPIELQSTNSATSARAINLEQFEPFSDFSSLEFLVHDFTEEDSDSLAGQADSSDTIIDPLLEPDSDQTALAVKILQPAAIVLQAANQVLFFEVIGEMAFVGDKAVLQAFSCLFAYENHLTVRSEALQQIDYASSNNSTTTVKTFACAIPKITPRASFEEKFVALEIVNDLSWQTLIQAEISLLTALPSVGQLSFTAATCDLITLSEFLPEDNMTCYLSSDAQAAQIFLEYLPSLAQFKLSSSRARDIVSSMNSWLECGYKENSYQSTVKITLQQDDDESDDLLLKSLQFCD